jgi:predicted histidine transporter YuiF (NhaC family)
MDSSGLELGKWALQIGGPMAGLLVLFFYFYRKDMQYYAGQAKEISEERKMEVSTLIAVIKDVTAAITRNSEVVQSLHVHMFEGERRKP